LKAKDILEKEGIPARVISFPSMELFAAQPISYRDEVLPPSVKARVVVEAASSFGWHQWAGSNGKFVTLERFGASAPGNVLFEKLGFTPGNIVAAAKECLKG
jgi:transketolase